MGWGGRWPPEAGGVVGGDRYDCRVSYWSEIVGQPEAVQALRRAADPEATPAHAWLITGPPGSGRSNLAYRFAAALIARDEGQRDTVYKQVRARTHPDLAVLTTQAAIIKIDAAREVVSSSYYAPAEGRYRVIVIEDADRMTEQTSNVLLKALEEPPERTVWVLCAPSEADLLPTIRSRARSLRLVTPSPARSPRCSRSATASTPRPLSVRPGLPRAISVWLAASQATLKLSRGGIARSSSPSASRRSVTLCVPRPSC